MNFSFSLDLISYVLIIWLLKGCCAQGRILMVLLCLMFSDKYFMHIRTKTRVTISIKNLDWHWKCMERWMGMKKLVCSDGYNVLTSLCLQKNGVLSKDITHYLLHRWQAEQLCDFSLVIHHLFPADWEMLSPLVVMIRAVDCICLLFFFSFFFSFFFNSQITDEVDIWHFLECKWLR